MRKRNGTTYALRAYTIRQSGEKFYIAATIAFEKPRWSKPYTSLQSAAMAVSRRLAEEWTARKARQSQEHGR